MKKGLKSLLLAGAFSALLANSAIAEEPKQPPKIEIIVNSKLRINQEPIQFLDSWAYFDPSYNQLSTGLGIPITPEDTTIVENVLIDVKQNNITSYSGLINSAQSLSEIQKLVLFSAIGGGLVLGSYDHSYPDNSVFPPDTFFLGWQNYLQTGNPNLLGVCRHLACHIERLADDLGMTAGVVTGTHSGFGHAYTPIKLENGTAIVDYNSILIVPTKNIEKVLDIYQKNVNSIAFRHLFFDETQFKYRLITKDGRNFLDFTGYDESSKTLKNSLIRDISQPANVTITSNVDDYETSVEMNIFGFFGKCGEIRGDSFSPLAKMQLAQIGYKNNFLLSDFLNIAPSLSFTSGTTDSEIGKNSWGIDGSLMIGTNNKEGINFNSRIAGNRFHGKNTVLFQDYLAEAGVSYKIPVINGLNIEPYVLSQLVLFPTDIGPYILNPVFNEFGVGAIFDIKTPNDLNISIEPYYLWKMWENKFGTNAKIGNKNIGLDLEGSLTRSSYEFCPHKYDIDAGLYAAFENFLINFKYSDRITDYDGEIGHNHSFSLQTNIKY